MLITAERILTGTDVLCPGWLEITDGTISALGQGTPPRPIDPTAGDLELDIKWRVPAQELAGQVEGVPSDHRGGPLGWSRGIRPRC